MEQTTHNTQTRKTKIVCSIGPACDSDGTIRAMIEAGMNVARFNFSHGTHEWHAQAMERVRRIAAALGVPVALMLDTKGPEIRTGMTEEGKDVRIAAGERVIVTADGATCRSADGETPCRISLSWKEAADRLRAGMRILIADGLVALEVRGASGGEIECVALNAGAFGSRKNVNLIGVHAGLPILGGQDKDDLRFGAEMDVDFVAASFVSFAHEVVEIKDFLRSVGSNARVIAKIENSEGLSDVTAIAREADGVMVARGDLGVQLPEEQIPLAQKKIIRACRRAGKPVITATQMLESMVKNPRPTRAELTDVANAVFDGTDAVMLSGETANGSYPVEAVRTMALVARTTEDSEIYRERMRASGRRPPKGSDTAALVAHSAYTLAEDIGAAAIIAPTMRGNTARLLGEFRPDQVVIAVTPDERVRRQLALQWGVVSVPCAVADSPDTMIKNAVTRALEKGVVSLNDTAVVCAGLPLESPSVANLIRVVKAGEVAQGK